MDRRDFSNTTNTTNSGRSSHFYRGLAIDTRDQRVAQQAMIAAEQKKAADADAAIQVSDALLAQTRATLDPLKDGIERGLGLEIVKPGFVYVKNLTGSASRTIFRGGDLNANFDQARKASAEKRKAEDMVRAESAGFVSKAGWLAGFVGSFAVGTGELSVVKGAITKAPEAIAAVKTAVPVVKTALTEIGDEAAKIFGSKTAGKVGADVEATKTTVAKEAEVGGSTATTSSAETHADKAASWAEQEKKWKAEEEEWQAAHPESRQHQQQQQQATAGRDGSSPRGRAGGDRSPPPVALTIHTAEKGKRGSISRSWFQRDPNNPIWYKNASIGWLTKVADELYEGGGSVTLSMEAMKAFQNRVVNMDLSDIRHASFVSLRSLFQVDELAKVVGDAALRRAYKRDVFPDLTADTYAAKRLSYIRDYELGIEEKLGMDPDGGWSSIPGLGFVVEPVLKIFTRTKAGRNNLIGFTHGVAKAAPVGVGLIGAVGGGLTVGTAAIAPYAAAMPLLASLDLMKPLANLTANWSDDNKLVQYWSTNSAYARDREIVAKEKAGAVAGAGSSSETIKRYEEDGQARVNESLKIDAVSAETKRRIIDELRRKYPEPTW